jgi:putative ABC transport system permease protein
VKTALRKVWRDLWNNKGRTLLVVLSIGVGVLALGMITASNTLLTRQMTLSQQASQPSNVTLYLDGLVDDETVKMVARLPEVVEAQGASSIGIRWKPSLDAEWQQASVIALDDYEHQSFDVVELRSGRWPSADEVAVEFNHVAPYGVPEAGGVIYFEVNPHARPMQVGGTVRDPQQFPPPFTDRPTFYVTRDALVALGGYRDFAQLKFTIPEYTEAKAELAADVVEKRLERIGVGVGFVQTQDPDRHFLQDLMDGVGLVLAVMATMSLGLSTILVVNTINAVIAQQIPQIGIMKTVGGLTNQIASLYLAGIAIYGLLSLLLAVPFGAFGADALARWMLSLINVPAGQFEILRTALVYQIGAGLITPLLAGLWPVLQGVAISVREALNAYGLGTGRYGTRLLDRVLGRVQGLPRMITLALRNTFRRAGRVALTEITLIAAGTIFMMVTSTHYSFNQTILTIFRSFGYDVIIGFEQFQRIDEIVPLIESRPDVDRAEMWVFYTAPGRQPGATGPGADHQVYLRGIPKDTQLFTPELTAGRGLHPEDGHAALLNQKLATDMGLAVGDEIELDLGDAGTSRWTIVGLIFDLAGQQQTAYLHRDTLNKELGLVGRASVAQIRATSTSLAAQEAVERDLRDYFQARGINLSFTNVARQEQEQANAQFSILTTLLLIMTFLIAVVGSFGLSGTLSINVLERRREIGVMRAVGASSGDVGFIFMGEGLLLGLLSWAQAVPLSMLGGKYFVDAIGEVIEFPAVYHYSFDGVWIWLGIVVVLSLLASGLPARRATQISVRESLAYE